MKQLVPIVLAATLLSAGYMATGATARPGCPDGLDCGRKPVTAPASTTPTSSAPASSSTTSESDQVCVTFPDGSTLCGEAACTDDASCNSGAGDEPPTPSDEPPGPGETDDDSDDSSSSASASSSSEDEGSTSSSDDNRGSDSDTAGSKPDKAKDNDEGKGGKPSKPPHAAAAAPKPKPRPKPVPKPVVVVPKPPPPPPSVCKNFYTLTLPGRTVKDAAGNCWHQDPSVDVLLDERTDKLVYHVGDLVTFTEKVVNKDSSEAPDVHLQKAIPPGMEILGRQGDVSWDYVDPNSGNHYTTLCHVEGGVGAQLVDCRFPLINSGEQWTITIIVRADQPGLYASNTAPEGTDSLSDPRRYNLAFAGTDKRADPEETANYGLSRVLVLGLIWDGKTYRTANQLVPWLKSHKLTWKQFKRRHPGAVHLLTGR